MTEWAAFAAADTRHLLPDFQRTPWSPSIG
jgi:hypothetical protein